jgi:hypothetical protein
MPFSCLLKKEISPHEILFNIYVQNLIFLERLLVSLDSKIKRPLLDNGLVSIKELYDSYDERKNG